VPESSKSITPFKKMQQISRNLETIIAFKKSDARADQEANIEKTQNKFKEDNTKAKSPTPTVALAGIIFAAGALATYLSTEISQIFDNLHKGFLDILGLTPKPEPEIDSTEALNLADIPAGPAEENINEIETTTPLDIEDMNASTEIKEIKNEIDAIEEKQLGFFNSIREFFGFNVQKPPAPPKPASPPKPSAPRQQRQQVAETDNVGRRAAPPPSRPPTQRRSIPGSSPPSRDEPPPPELPPPPSPPGGPPPPPPPPGEHGQPPTPPPRGSGGPFVSQAHSGRRGQAGNEDIMRRAMDEMNMRGNSQRAGLAAIIKGESGFQAISEDMRYSSARALEIFKYTPKGGWDAIVEKGEKYFAEEVYGVGTQNKAAHQLGNDKPGDGWNYRGKGFIQLTGKANYKDIGQAIGVDLVSNPDLMLDPYIAAKASVVYMQRNHRRGGLGSFQQQLAAVGGSQAGWGLKTQYYNQYMKDGTFNEGKPTAPAPQRTAASPAPEPTSTAPTITVTQNTETNAQQTVESFPKLSADDRLNARNLSVADIVKAQDKASVTLSRFA